MKPWIAFVFSIITIFGSSQAHAARLFLSTGSTLQPGEVGGVPTIDATTGTEYDLHVWLLPDADQNYIGAAWSVATNNPAAVTAVSSTADNPVNTGNSLTRWGNVNGGTINATRDPDAGGPLPTENLLTDNARGAVIVIGTNSGIGSLAQHATDPGRDAASGAFHLGTLRVRATGTTGSAGLYLRQGQNLMNIRNGAGTTITTSVPLFFGNTQTSPVNAGSGGRNLGDPLDPNNVGADAILNFGGVTPRLELIQFTDDPNNMGQLFVVPGPSNTGPINFALTPPANMVQLDAQNVQHSFFDVFFDLNQENEAALAALAATLQAQEADEGLNFVRVLNNGENPLANGIDYDIHIQYSNTPGANRFVDVDFSSIPGMLINNIAIPEPSTWALAACGLIGLALTRRRR